jgi:predicted alpha/beta-hydrolase family hydrolase
VATADSQSMEIVVDDATRVSGILIAPPDATACFVVAHGAGAGMHHPFMAKLASDLAGLRIATLRYQFPYMERRGKRPDTPALCHATVRAAIAAAAAHVPSLPLIAGGKSFGGRMTSQAQASVPLPGVRGLVFLGFPLHPPKQPSDARGEHLARVHVPMLFLQGARDAFAEPELLNPLVKRLGSLATLRLLRDADHSFHVPARGGVTDAEINAEMLAALAAWAQALASPARPTGTQAQSGRANS